MADIYPGIVTEWTVVDTSSGDDDEVTCTKAAESGKAHFITFVSAGSCNTSHVAGGAIKAKLYAGAGETLLLELWVGDCLDSGINTVSFPAPIRIAENKAAVFAITMSGTDDQATFTMGGFTR